jgi:hypothetical protein
MKLGRVESGGICMVRWTTPSKTLPRERSTPRADWTLSHMGNKPVDVEGLGTARDPDPRQGISRRPAVDQGTASGRPGNACLEPVQGSLARLSGDETDAEELGGRNHEDICNSSNVDSKVLKEKLVSLLLGDVGPNRPQVDEDGKALEIGHMMQGSGSSSRQAVRLGGAAAGSSYFCIGHAGWKSG